MGQVATAYKIAYHKEKLEAYLKGGHIFPATLELDLTSQCTRVCADCPSCTSPHHSSLSMGFLTNLFDSLQGQTRGLLLTGGEATMSPLFPEALALARNRGFEEIAVVTNGSLLHEGRVVDALLQYVSTIRVSMYDWDEASISGIKPVLERIEALRMRIDREKSPLKIGISVLTSRERSPRLTEIADAVREAGAHWVYYHPLCTGWETATLVQADQEGVLDTINRYRQNAFSGFGVSISPARYLVSDLRFRGYHAAHFLLVIGADGKNYLGPEVKYHDKFVIADLGGGWDSGFLHRARRLEQISSVGSHNFSALGSRHRGVLYNDYIEKLIDGQLRLDASSLPIEGEIQFPHIL